MNPTNNNQTIVEPIMFDPKAKKTDGRRKRATRNEGESSDTVVITKKKRAEKGDWTPSRRLAVLKKYKEFRPYGVPHNQKTEQWNQFTRAINQIDAVDRDGNKKSNPVSVKSVREKLTLLVDTYRPFFSRIENDKRSGSNKGKRPDEEEAAYDADAYIEEDKKSVVDKKKKNKDDLDRKEEEMQELEEDALYGRRYHETVQKEKNQEFEGKGKAPADITSVLVDENDNLGQEDMPIDVDNLDSAIKESLDKRETEQAKVLRALDQLHQDNLELKYMFGEVLEALKNNNK